MFEKGCWKSIFKLRRINNLLTEIEQTLNTRSLTYLSDNNEDDAITPSHLLYGQNITRRNFIYFVTEYCEQDNALLSKYKRFKMILSHFKKRFFEEYILALREKSVRS